ncbi:hypothetical protein GT348_05945 [Aristophania vespae]|uniref:Uncharacterized protein n=1 Tax=Aristophania vespae TaxID=2697033 RepID=A0A6P1NEG4_9PROT|nr:hypothetical protein [Aristophania vespae]QHI95848.1 hypothetical protein GT348_05945 [Aristophania vespae]
MPGLGNFPSGLKKRFPLLCLALTGSALGILTHSASSYAQDNLNAHQASDKKNKTILTPLTMPHHRSP